MVLLYCTVLYYTVLPTIATTTSKYVSWITTNQTDYKAAMVDSGRRHYYGIRVRGIPPAVVSNKQSFTIDLISDVFVGSNSADKGTRGRFNRSKCVTPVGLNDANNHQMVD